MIKIAKKVMSERKKQEATLYESLYTYFFNYGFRCSCHIKKMLTTKNRIIKKIRADKLEEKYNIRVGIGIKIGRNLQIKHPLGVVLGEGAVIGDDCIIYQNVTIGQKKDLYPHIGNNVTIYPNSCIFGNITIGNNVTIGAGSVVNKSLPDNCVVAGNPAKVIKGLSPLNE